MRHWWHLRRHHPWDHAGSCRWCDEFNAPDSDTAEIVDLDFVRLLRRLT